MDVWTQRLTISWRPTLAFFERRYDVLRELEQKRLLNNFRVEEGSISARLGDAMHAVSYGAGRIDLSTFRPEPDMTRMRDALALLVANLDLAPARMALGIQALEPVDADYDEVRNDALAAVFPNLPGGQQRDFASLLEELKGPVARWTIDVGVVERNEIPPRLARERSRIARRDTQSPPSLWPPESLPAVALYSDGEFALVDRIAEPVLDNLVERWETLLTHAEEVISAVFAQLNPLERP